MVLKTDYVAGNPFTATDQNTLNSTINALDTDLGTLESTVTALGVDVDSVQGTLGTARTVTLCGGGQGNNTSPGENLAQVGTRLILRPNSKTKEWRLKIRQYPTGLEVGGGVQPSVPVTGKGIKRGLTSYDTTGQPTGNFTGTVTTMVASDFTIPGDKSAYTTAWVTDPALQLNPVDNLFAVGWTKTAASTIYGATGLNWRFATSAAALDTAQAASGVGGGIPFDIQLEYKVESPGICGLFIGDSIMEGVGGEVKTSSPVGGLVPWHKSWPQRWAEMTGNYAVNLALSSTNIANWGPIGDDKWTRVDIAAAKPDFVCIGLGANDPSTALATMQSGLKTVIDNARSKTSVDTPIYIATTTPRATAAARLVEFDVWLRTLPWGIAGLLDFGLLMSDSEFAGGAYQTGNYGVGTPYPMNDGLHLTRVGMERQAIIARSALPSRKR